jgi:tRNA threonylcarbamoyladenosine biosynthesis protein TsaB
MTRRWLPRGNKAVWPGRRKAEPLSRRNRVGRSVRRCLFSAAMTEIFTLVLETSTPHASLAAAGPDGTVEFREFTSDRSHNAALFGPLRELLDPREFPKLVLVGSGPGSYSGTRVGIAAAQGVAIASGCPAVAVPSILAVSSAENGARCLAIGDARRGSYWTAGIEASHLLTEPELTDADGLLKAVETTLSEGIPVFTFEPPDRFPLPSGFHPQIRLEFPDARRLWHAWSAAPAAARDTWSAAPPQPIYLKPPHITPAKRPWLVQP